MIAESAAARLCRARLQAIDSTSDAELLADVILLAWSLRATIPTLSSAKAEESVPSEDDTLLQNERILPKLPVSNTLDHSSRARLFPPLTAPAGQPFLPASFVKVSAGEALPERRELERALRPFKRRLPSRVALELDPTATAEASAERRAVTPVWRPTLERWFDVALLVEHNDAMQIWEDTFTELQRLLARHGAFRRVRLWRQAVRDGVLVLSTRNGAAALPRVVADHTGRCLCLFFTHGTAIEWQQPSLLEFLVQIGRASPVAIVQMLPRRAWGHTLLGDAFTELHSRAPGTAANRLRKRDPFSGEIKPVHNGLTLPILTLEPDRFANWARFVTATRETVHPALTLSVRPEGESFQAEINPLAVLTPRQRVVAFRAIASREAWQFLRLLAGVPLTIPVMRLMQMGMPGVKAQVHLAEILLGGLVHRVTRPDDIVPLDEVEYDFAFGVRDVLLESLSIDESQRIDDSLRPINARARAYVEAHAGQKVDTTRALTVDEAGNQRLLAAAKSFLSVSQRLFKQRYDIRNDSQETALEPAFSSLEFNFLSQTEVENLVRTSSVLSQEETNLRLMLLYGDDMRQLWLVASLHALMIVDDTEETRVQSKLLVRRDGWLDALPIITAIGPPSAHAVRFGLTNQQSWPYSRDRYRSSSVLRARIHQLLPKDAAKTLLSLQELSSVYDATRSQPSGTDRTSSMSAVAMRMRNQLPQKSLNLQFLTASSSAGNRLVAIMSLSKRFEIKFLDWLIKCVTKEEAFLAYQAANILQKSQALLSIIDKRRLASGLSTAKQELRLRGLMDPGVHGILTDILKFEPQDSSESSTDKFDNRLGKPLESPKLFHRETPSATQPDTSLEEKASILRRLAISQAMNGDRETALQTSQQAVEIYRLLAVQNSQIFRPELAKSLNSLAENFAELGHFESALLTAQEEVHIYRELSAASPDTFKPILAASLIELTNRLRDFENYEQAVLILQEAVDIYRTLTVQHPELFKSYLASSLYNLISRFSELNNYQAALSAAKESVDIYRTLSGDKPGGYRSELAASITSFASTLSELGQDESALLAAQEAVLLRRELAAENPDDFRLDLAKSLNNLADRLSAMGQLDPALAAAQEAVDLNRILIKQRPDASKSELAKTLTNLSIRFSEIGRGDAALETAEESVSLYRTLVSQRPDIFRASLAQSITNLANRLSELGQRETALSTAQEAVDLYRVLAAKQPDLYKAALATSLNNLANRFSDMGQREQALPIAQEAVNLRRILAAKRPDLFKAALATSLNNLANIFGGLDQREQAFSTAQEAVDLYRTLAAEQPNVLNSALAGSLNNLANRFSGLGQREQALSPAQEAVDLYRALVAQRPDVFKGALAQSLNNLANKYSDLGQRELALSTALEAVDLYQVLTVQQPDVFKAALAQSVNNLAYRLSDLGQREAALSTAQKAVDLYRVLAAKQPDLYKAALATSLNNLANRFSDMGQRERALPIAQEAVDLYRTLVAQRPNVFKADLAGSLNDLANVLSGLGQRESALLIAQEAVDLYRALAVQRPDVFKTALAQSLNNLGNRFNDLGQHEPALSTAQEAVDLRRALAAQRPDIFNADLAMSLNNLAVALSSLGQYELALLTAQEAVNHYRALTAQRPDVFEADLAGSLNNLANILSGLGQRERALSTAQEAVDHYRVLAAQRPDVFKHTLARSLHSLAVALNSLDQHKPALSTAQEAFDLYHALAAERPDVFNAILAKDLNNLVDSFNDLKKH